MKILLLSGRKGSGKDSLANYLLGTFWRRSGIIHDFSISKNGVLRVHGPLHSIEESNYNKSAKKFGFAERFKQGVCIDMMGLTSAAVYNSERENLSIYCWENMPGLRDTPHYDRVGLMTNREVMEYMASFVFLKIDPLMAARSCLRDIVDSGTEVAVIKDCRRLDEIKYFRENASKNDVKVIRLLRNPYNSNSVLESELDPYRFNYKEFDAIHDNSDSECGIEESCKMFHKELEGFGWL